jgi:hypothetical protein
VSADQSTRSQQPLTEQQRYQAATDEGSLWRKVIGMNPDSATLKKYGFDNDSYNAAEHKYKEVSPGAIARGSDFDPATQKIYNAGDHNSVVRGAEKGLTQTLSGTSQLAGKAVDTLGLRSSGSKGQGIFGEAPASAAETQPEGVGEHVGFIGENLMEFIAGDEALKSLSLAQKLGVAVKIAKLSETSPTAAKLISAGLRATRTGTVSAGQELAHGGDASDAAIAGGTGFLSSVGSEGLGALAKLAKPGVKEIAGETVQTVPKWKSASDALKLAAENQAPAQKVVANVAHDSANAITKKFGKDAPDTIKSFRDAAQAVESAAKPIFQKLDEISNGGFQTAKNELDAANKIARRATSMEDLQGAEKAATTAQAKIDKIFTDSAGKVAPEDLQNARSAWRSKKVLEQLHSKIDQAFDMPQSASDISGATRTLDLSKIQGRLNAAFQKLPQQDLENVLGKEGTKSLFELAKIGGDPARAKTLGEIAQNIGSHLSTGGAGVLIGGAAGHAIPGGSIALGLHFLYSHPEAGALVAKGVSKGLNPKLIVPAVIHLIDSQRQDQNQGIR